ncbi:hypothetical protein HBH64_172470 [Parastagonospora nodorum]|nr:hypothetical protein HBI01_172660 [Parastagonospora nodorum]KAH4295975.1 hypothetical protein HBI02_171490 [Parastagonospora nodorum]KAH4324693.1 hypothetical protein HBI00_163270 [Parastagonospora nodorum]KAH4362069.1 hypothetical protein HBH94_178740 [Parastagonospora nodorum]KAH4457527.1 hypothetical protein HBH90_159980 [Parastagonospora nodorum]
MVDPSWHIKRLTIRNSISILSHSTQFLLQHIHSLPQQAFQASSQTSSNKSHNRSLTTPQQCLPASPPPSPPSSSPLLSRSAGRNATAAAAKSPAGALSCKPASDKWQSDSNFRGISGVETGQGLVYS